MNILYISDLDGTLLSNNATLTKRTVRILNDLIRQGVLFTVATARSIASAKYILEELELTLPIILMNGACIYDPLKKDYIKTETLNSEDAGILLSMIAKNHFKGFLYTIENGNLATYYEELHNDAMKQFHDERVNKYNKVFSRTENFSSLIDKPILYFTLMDNKENLEQLSQMIKELPHINSVFYKDNYSKDMWYLEIFSKNTSKYHSVQFLRRYLSVDMLIGFGDNQNDMALFDACDKGYAVENAINELKLRADGVIGKNTNDAVALWIKQNHKKEHDLY